MRILLLAHSFNSLTQRLWVELAALGHELSLELDVSDALTADAVRRFAPDVVLAPFLKRAIAEEVWRSVRCLVIHPASSATAVRPHSTGRYKTARRTGA